MHPSGHLLPGVQHLAMQKIGLRFDLEEVRWAQFDSPSRAFAMHFGH